MAADRTEEVSNIATEGSDLQGPPDTVRLADTPSLYGGPEEMPVFRGPSTLDPKGSDGGSGSSHDKVLPRADVERASGSMDRTDPPGGTPTPQASSSRTATAQASQVEEMRLALTGLLNPGVSLPVKAKGMH